MRTKEVNVYTYDELSQRAKDAVKIWLNDDDNGLLQESLEEELSETVFTNATISYSLNSCQGDGVSFTGEWSGLELKNIINASYNSTGISVPPKVAKIILEATLTITRDNRCHYMHEMSVDTNLLYEGELDLGYSTIGPIEKIIDEYRISICKMLEKQGYKEIDYSNSEDAMSETCESNDYEFYANGELVS
jgi:hypothetical protein